MKKSIVVFIGLISFFSCNDTKQRDNFEENKVKVEMQQESKLGLNLDDTLVYGDRGMKYALNTQAVLGKNLVEAIKISGTLGALTFCNEKAYPLTDSMAIVHNANIKRITDKPRNQNNQADTEALEYIETFKQVVENAESVIPIVKESDDKIHVYYPILTNPMCLQCHGKPNKNIASSTLKQLTLLYPKDKAIGYDVNEVRGLWRVDFDK